VSEDRTHSARSRQARDEAIFALLLALLPNLILTGVGLVMSKTAQQVVQDRAMSHFGLERLLRQVGVNAFLLLPMGIWLWRRRAGLVACGWGRARLGKAVIIGALLGAAALLLRAHPFAPERLTVADTWWALVTYSVVALAEETLFRGFLQSRLEGWLGHRLGWLMTALLFTAIHLPARLLGGEPLNQALFYAATQLLPMSLFFGAAMWGTQHVAAPTLLHLAWNWASVIRR